MNLTQFGHNPSTQVPRYTEIFQEPDGLRIFRLVLISMVIFCSLVGNFIVCKTVWKIAYRKPFSYYLVANVAVAELINSLCVPFIVVYEEKRSWILGKASCILANPLLVLSMCVITNSFAIIAVYRYRVTLNKTMPAGFMKAIIVAGVWFMALAITLPLFVTRRLIQHSEEHIECRSYFPGDINTANDNYNKYTIVRLIFTFAVPYFVILTAYIALAITLKLFVHKTSTGDPQIDMSSFASSQTPSTAEHALQGGNANTTPPMVDGKRSTEGGRTHAHALERTIGKRRNTRRRNLTIETAEKNLFKTIFVVILIFVVCYTPYQGMFLWEYFGEFNDWQFYYHKLLRDYLFILKYLPSAVHPICYGTMNNIFARAFSKFFICMCK